jgi:hypothetical protein
MAFRQKSIALFFLIALVFVMQCNRRANLNIPKVNYWNDIQPIIENRCYPCHGDNGSAPIKLVNYNQTKSFIGMINYAVLSGYMPPWLADTNNSCSFSNQREISKSEIEALKNWEKQQCPEGTKLAIVAKSLASENTKPDLILKLQTPVQLPENNTDYFTDVVFPLEFSEARAISAIEVRTHQPKYAHHALYTIRTQNPQHTNSTAFDEKVFFDKDVVMAGGWAPGWGAMRFPKKTGFYLPAKGSLNLNMHYNHIEAPTVDSIEIFIWYAKDSIKRNCEFMGIDALATESIQLSSPFEIPAGEVKAFLMSKKLNQAISILSVSPHMHLLGKSFKAYAVTPLGDTLKIISIPRWNFNWQDIYNCSPVLCLEKGTTIYIEAVYDNTIQNLNNPNYPPIDVKGGWTTDKEMLTFIIIGMLYQKGDENLTW